MTTKTSKHTPNEGQIVHVAGGLAQYRSGVFYTGMEEPKWTRPIKWKVEWWSAAGQLCDRCESLTYSTTCDSCARIVALETLLNHFYRTKAKPFRDSFQSTTRLISLAWMLPELVQALELAINTVECASIDMKTGEELPWYANARKLLARYHEQEESK